MEMSTSGLSTDQSRQEWGGKPDQRFAPTNGDRKKGTPFQRGRGMHGPKNALKAPRACLAPCAHSKCLHQSRRYGSLSRDGLTVASQPRPSRVLALYQLIIENAERMNSKPREGSGNSTRLVRLRTWVTMSGATLRLRSSEVGGRAKIGR